MCSKMSEENVIKMLFIENILITFMKIRLYIDIFRIISKFL